MPTEVATGEVTDVTRDLITERIIAVSLELTIQEETDLTTEVSEELGKHVAKDVAIIMETYVTSHVSSSSKLYDFCRSVRAVFFGMK